MYLSLVDVNVWNLLSTCYLANILIEHRHKLLKFKPFGFQKHKSCSLQLIDCTNEWIKTLESKNTFDVVYIDFQKAFDSVVPHTKLLAN